MAKIEEYLKMNSEQLEEAIIRERAKIRKAKIEINLLEKLKIANQESRRMNERQSYGSHVNGQGDDTDHS